MNQCNQCDKKATQKYHQLTRPGEHYFCDEHAKEFVNLCNQCNIEYMRGVLE